MKIRFKIVGWFVLALLSIYGFVITIPLWLITGFNALTYCLDGLKNLNYENK